MSNQCLIANEGIKVDTPYGPGFLRETGVYPDGSAGLIIEGEEGPICKLTVNLNQGKLSEGLYLVKTWSENTRIVESLMKQGIFEDTGIRHNTGNVTAQVWKLKE